MISPEAEAELQAFLRSIDFNNAATVTLTMKKRSGARVADEINASDNFRDFHKRLDHAILGSRAKRYGRRLKMVVVLRTKCRLLHYRCILNGPTIALSKGSVRQCEIIG